MCLAVLIADTTARHRPRYAEFKKFKEVRAEIYDYGSIPGYYENMPFYKESKISEVTYRAISGRFLNVDETVNTETLTTISACMKDIRSARKSTFNRVFSRLEIVENSLKQN